MTAPDKDLDALHEKWVDWARQMWRHVVDLQKHRQMWREMLQAFERRDLLTNSWWHHYSRLYWDSQAMRVRRLVDDDPNVVSLVRLIEALRSNPRVVTWERFREIWGEDLEWNDVPRNTWRRLIGDTTEITHDVLDRMIERLSTSCDNIRAVADRRIAHADLRGLDGSVTYLELHEAIDVLTEEFRTVALLLTASDYVCDPSLDDWTRPFRRTLWDPLPIDAYFDERDNPIEPG